METKSLIFFLGFNVKLGLEPSKSGVFTFFHTEHFFSVESSVEQEAYIESHVCRYFFR